MKSQRTREIARIHCLRRDCMKHDKAFTDKDYRDILWTVSRQRSSKYLDDVQRMEAIKQLEARLNKAYPGEPHNIDNKRRKELTKIKAYLADAGKPWSYAHTLAKRICGKERIQFCGGDELYKIITALELDARKRLIPLLEAELAKWDWPWESINTIACREFGFGGTHMRFNSKKNAYAMSLVLRWFKGEKEGSGVVPRPQHNNGSEL